MRRTLGLAAVSFALVAAVTGEAVAQNLEAGKSPGQVFSQTCTACHRSPRGLLRSVPPGSLPGFLREHYTTSRDMAQQLSGFLIANGATDPRARQDIRRPDEPRQDFRQDSRQDSRQDPRLDPRQRQDGRGAPLPPNTVPQQEPRPGETPPQQAARPDSARPDSAQPNQSADPRGRNARRQAAEAAAAARLERRQKNRRYRVTPESRIEAAKDRGREALPLGDVIRTMPPATPKAEPPPVAVAKPEPGNPDAAVVDAPKPAAESPRPDTSRTAPVAPPLTASQPPSDAPMRADPVPQVTPAPPPASVETRPAPVPSESRPRAPADDTPRPAPSEAPSLSVTPPPSSSMPAPPISQ